MELYFIYGKEKDGTCQPLRAPKYHYQMTKGYIQNSQLVTISAQHLQKRLNYHVESILTSRDPARAIKMQDWKSNKPQTSKSLASYWLKRDLHYFFLPNFISPPTKQSKDKFHMMHLSLSLTLRKLQRGYRYFHLTLWRFINPFILFRSPTSHSSKFTQPE